MKRDDTVGLREASEILGVHYMTVYRHVRTGRLAATWDGAEWRVRGADLTASQRAPKPPRRRPGKSRPDATHRVDELVTRLIAGDEAGAWWIIEFALAGGASPKSIYVDFIAVALQRIGDSWADGAVTIADEHRASAVAHRLIGRMGPRFRPPGRRRGGVVVGAIEGDLHGLPSAIVADLLRSEGYEVVDLGADVPRDSFVEAALAIARLRGVAIAVTSPQAPPAIPALVAELRRAGITAPVLVGGSGVTDEVAVAGGATAYTRTADDVIARLRESEAGTKPR